MNREPKPIDSPRDIPAGLSDEERTAFLEEHGVSEYFLENAEEASEEERPRPRTKPINVRFHDFTFGRFLELAGLSDYQLHGSPHRDETRDDSCLLTREVLQRSLVRPLA